MAIGLAGQLGAPVPQRVVHRESIGGANVSVHVLEEKVSVKGRESHWTTRTAHTQFAEVNNHSKHVL